MLSLQKWVELTVALAVGKPFCFHCCVEFGCQTYACSKIVVGVQCRKAAAPVKAVPLPQQRVRPVMRHKGAKKNQTAFDSDPFASVWAIALRTCRVACASRCVGWFSSTGSILHHATFVLCVLCGKA